MLLLRTKYLLSFAPIWVIFHIYTTLMLHTGIKNMNGKFFQDMLVNWSAAAGGVVQW